MSLPQLFSPASFIFWVPAAWCKTHLTLGSGENGGLEAGVTSVVQHKMLSGSLCQCLLVPPNLPRALAK